MSATDERPIEPPRALTITGLAVAFWSLAYALPHMIWATGSRWGLSAVNPDVTFSQWRMINGIASAVLCAAAVLGVALVRLWDRPRFKYPLLSVALVGCAVGIAHGIYGIVDRLLTVSGAGRDVVPGADGPAPAWLLWDLIVFEPWFLIEGVLIGLAGRHFLVGQDARRRWSYIAAAATCLALGLALAQVKVG